MAWSRTYNDSSPQNFDRTNAARNPEMNRLRWVLFGATLDTTNREPLFHVPLQIQPASTANASFGLQIDQDNNAIALDIDTEATTTDGINLSIAAMTTGIGLDIPDGDLLTTGQLARFSSNAPATDTRSLVTILNDNTAATGTTLLDLDQDAAQRVVFINMDAATGGSIVIDAETTTWTSGIVDIDADVLSTGTAFRIDADRLTTGSIVVFSSNGTDTGTKSLVQIIADNTSATGTTALEIQQDAAQRMVFLDHDAITGGSLVIDAETTTWTSGIVDIDADVLTTGTALRIDADSLTTGTLATFSSNSTDTGTKTLVNVVNDATAATGTTVATFQQDAAVRAVFIDQNAVTGGSLVVDAETTTWTSGIVDIDADVLTTGTAFRVDGDSVTTGSLAVFASNSTDTGARNLVDIINDNVAATTAIPLNIQQDGTGPAARFHITSTAAVALHFTGAGTAGAATWFATTSTPAANLFLKISVLGTTMKIKLDDN